MVYAVCNLLYNSGKLIEFNISLGFPCNKKFISIHGIDLKGPIKKNMHKLMYSRRCVH